MLLWISLFCALVSAGIIAYLLSRHWKEIRLLDTDTIKSEQERNARNRIVRERFERQLKKWSVPVKRATRTMSQRLASSIQQMESHVKGQKKESSGENASEGKKQPKTKVEKMLALANQLATEKKVSRAERIYLEILKLDMRQPDAYQGLGELYLSDRQYKQAKETLQFLVSLNAATDQTYASLAKIAEVDGNMGKAEEMRKKALERSQNAPRRQAELAEHYLKCHKPNLAWEHAQSAMRSDGENERYIELSAESAILLGDRESAERLYQDLRLRDYDQIKLESLKEKIEEMEET